jgi:nucleotide-binding universal stress UspA family protein
MKFLYATDGSIGARGGARFLNALPPDKDGHIHLLSVIQHAGEEDVAEAALTAAQEDLADSGTRFTREIRRGNAAEEIVRAAEETPTDLIVVGTRGLAAVPRFFLGSVAERVARHAPCPVLLARPLTDRLDRVILGLDSSEGAAHAAAWLQAFPLPPECEVRLVTVVTPAGRVSSGVLMPSLAAEIRTLVQQEHDEADRRLKALGASFTGSGRQVATERREDDPASGLLTVADEQNADLIVVGSRGLSGVDRFLLGSVAEKVMRHAHCSVLVVRRPGTE